MRVPKWPELAFTGDSVKTRAQKEKSMECRDHRKKKRYLVKGELWVREGYREQTLEVDRW